MASNKVAAIDGNKALAIESSKVSYFSFIRSKEFLHDSYVYRKKY